MMALKRGGSMAAYEHILVASDLAEDSRHMAERGVALASQFGARLSFIHVVELIPINIEDGLIVPQAQELESQLQQIAVKKLNKLVAELNVTDAAVHVSIGETKYEIVDYAKSQKVDLIVIGKHRRRGLARLLGSTANGVANHAECDVLIVTLADS